MITIRQMELDDLEEVLAIENRLFSVPWSETGFFSFLIREDTLFLVALEDGRIVGYCGAVTVLNEGDITNVAVAPERQRRGIGRQLLQAMIEKTGAQGVEKLFLEVRASNTGALALYRNLDFQEVGLRKDYYESPIEDGILMRRG